MKRTPLSSGTETGATLRKTSSVPDAPDLEMILTALQTMRAGDFSVRLPGSWVGLSGKIADTFNSIVSANHQISIELKRVGQVVGKEQ